MKYIHHKVLNSEAKWTAIIVFGIIVLATTLIVIACETEKSEDLSKLSEIGEVVLKFKQYDLTKKSERLKCLNMLQSNSHVLHNGWHTTEQSRNRTFMTLLEIIDQHNTEAFVVVQ